MRVPTVIALIVLVLGVLTVPFLLLRQDVTAAGGSDQTAALPVQEDEEVEALPTAEPDAAETTAPSPSPAATSEAATSEPSPEADADPVEMLLSSPEPTPDSGPPPLEEDPDEVAAWLVAAEQAIRHPSASLEQLAYTGHIQQAAYRIISRHPEWLDHALAAAPEELHPVIRANAGAGAALRAMHTPADPNAPVEVKELPAWRISEPAPADELLAYYKESEAASGTPWYYLAAVNLVETRMGRIQGVSVAGAQGPMQFMPATWGEWGDGGDVTDPRDAIMAAGRFLAWGGMPDDVDGAIFKYNRDVRYVQAVRTYAEQMRDDERAFHGYYHWQVYFYTGAEDVWLPPGYDRTGE